MHGASHRLARQRVCLVLAVLVVVRVLMMASVHVVVPVHLVVFMLLVRRMLLSVPTPTVVRRLVPPSVVRLVARWVVAGLMVAGMVRVGLMVASAASRPTRASRAWRPRRTAFGVGPSVTRPPRPRGAGDVYLERASAHVGTHSRDREYAEQYDDYKP